MKRLTHLNCLLFCILLVAGCQRTENSLENNPVIAYDIFPVIGQSNAYNGFGLDYEIDVTDPRIQQLGRFDSNNYKIIAARDPLEHHTLANGRNGFAMTFALKYLQYYWEGNRQVLLIPGAKDGSSFRNREWNKGDTLYNDIVRRIKYVLEKYPGSKVRAFLWHQGESDVYWGRDYAGMLDRMIVNMRRDVAGSTGDSIPFILGGLVSYWVSQRNDRKITDSVISETPERVSRTGYASAREPFIITKPDNTVDDIHFNAAGQRELGRRYFNVYRALKK
ncbi:protein of unknown function (DUF303) [Lacibacter cauensis]|uniref:Sialate O-acetylesterase domain-containing protein n=1 Tax=Lacibacter cauensis TaxID=510947 RepID=A0A562SJM3_9BACT|nr:sialate O-acetylesterase [Lacibacter cauensis]TWI81412.1 protein of unknown function (DUF303) [Lacibacter cauensis]